MVFVIVVDAVILIEALVAVVVAIAVVSSWEFFVASSGTLTASVAVRE
jgi:hypothetical protein